MASFITHYAKKKMMNGDVVLTTQTINVGLVTSSFNGTASHEFVATPSVLGELSGTGYTRKTLASKTATADTSNARAEFDADDVAWTGINAGTAAGLIILRFVTTDADSPLIGYIDTGGFPITTNGGDVTVQWNAEGIIQLA